MEYDMQQLKSLLINNSNMLNNTIQKVYCNLLNFYNNDPKDMPPEIQNKLLNIISLIEVKEDYNKAIVELNNLISLMNDNCSKYYVNG